jgi:hypothetical protein
MQASFINTRADLDAITGTPAHDTFMAALAGSVWRLEKDDDLKTWKAVQDASTIERYGFDLSDCANVPAPALPAYVPPPSKVPTSLTMRQARLALLGAGLLDAVQAGVSAMPQAAQIEWEFAATVERTSPLTATLAAALGLDDAALDALFMAGAAL